MNEEVPKFVPKKRKFSLKFNPCIANKDEDLNPDGDILAYMHVKEKLK